MRFQNIFSVLLIPVYFLTQVISPSIAFAEAGMSEVKLPVSFEIPGELGQITDREILPHARGTLIHIQDAHSVFDAQKSIQKIIGKIHSEFNVSQILLEGGNGKLDPEMRHFFPSGKKLTQNEREKWMHEGDLTGAEAFLMEESQAEGFGVEPTELYLKNREAYRQVYAAQDLSDSFLKEFFLRWQETAQNILKPSFKKYLESYAAARNNSAQLSGWLNEAADFSAQELKRDLSDLREQAEFPMLVRYFHLQKIEKAWDFKVLEKEKQAFYREARQVSSVKDSEKLEKILGEIDALYQVSKTHQALHGFPRDAFERLAAFLPADFSMSKWPELKKFIEYLILSNELDARELENEAKKLHRKIVRASIENENADKVTALLEKYILIKKLFHLELTRNEYQKVKQLHLRPVTLVAKMRYLAGNGFSGVENKSIQKLNAAYEAALGFYQGAIQRESDITTEALNYLGKSKEKKAILVTGGFHTEGIRETILKNGYSYLQIIPRISKITSEDSTHYRRALLGDSTHDSEQVKNNESSLVPALLTSAALTSNTQGRMRIARLTQRSEMREPDAVEKFFLAHVHGSWYDHRFDAKQFQNAMQMYPEIEQMGEAFFSQLSDQITWLSVNYAPDLPGHMLRGPSQPQTVVLHIPAAAGKQIPVKVEFAEATAGAFWLFITVPNSNGTGKKFLSTHIDKTKLPKNEAKRVEIFQNGSSINQGWLISHFGQNEYVQDMEQIKAWILRAFALNGKVTGGQMPIVYKGKRLFVTVSHPHAGRNAEYEVYAYPHTNVFTGSMRSEARKEGMLQVIQQVKEIFQSYQDSPEVAAIRGVAEHKIIGPYKDRLNEIWQTLHRKNFSLQEFFDLEKGIGNALNRFSLDDTLKNNAATAAIFHEHVWQPLDDLREKYEELVFAMALISGEKGLTRNHAFYDVFSLNKANERMVKRIFASYSADKFQKMTQLRAIQNRLFSGVAFESFFAGFSWDGAVSEKALDVLGKVEGHLLKLESLYGARADLDSGKLGVSIQLLKRQLNEVLELVDNLSEPENALKFLNYLDNLKTAAAQTFLLEDFFNGDLSDTKREWLGILEAIHQFAHELRPERWPAEWDDDAEGALQHLTRASGNFREAYGNARSESREPFLPAGVLSPGISFELKGNGLGHMPTGLGVAAVEATPVPETAEEKRQYALAIDLADEAWSAVGRDLAVSTMHAFLDFLIARDVPPAIHTMRKNIRTKIIRALLIHVHPSKKKAILKVIETPELDPDPLLFMQKIKQRNTQGELDKEILRALVSYFRDEIGRALRRLPYSFAAQSPPVKAAEADRALAVARKNGAEVSFEWGAVHLLQRLYFVGRVFDGPTKPLEHIASLIPAWVVFQLGYESHIQRGVDMAYALAVSHPYMVQALSANPEYGMPPVLEVSFEENPEDTLGKAAPRTVRFFVLKDGDPHALRTGMSYSEFQEKFEWNEDAVRQMAFDPNDTEIENLRASLNSFLQAALEGRLLMINSYDLKPEAFPAYLDQISVGTELPPGKREELIRAFEAAWQREPQALSQLSEALKRAKVAQAVENFDVDEQLRRMPPPDAFLGNEDEVKASADYYLALTSRLRIAPELARALPMMPLSFFPKKNKDPRFFTPAQTEAALNKITQIFEEGSPYAAECRRFLSAISVQLDALDERFEQTGDAAERTSLENQALSLRLQAADYFVRIMGLADESQGLPPLLSWHEAWMSRVYTNEDTAIDGRLAGFYRLNLDAKRSDHEARAREITEWIQGLLNQPATIRGAWEPVLGLRDSEVKSRALRYSIEHPDLLMGLAANAIEVQGRDQFDIWRSFLGLSSEADFSREAEQRITQSRKKGAEANAIRKNIRVVVQKDVVQQTQFLIRGRKAIRSAPVGVNEWQLLKEKAGLLPSNQFSEDWRKYYPDFEQPRPTDEPHNQERLQAEIRMIEMLQRAWEIRQQLSQPIPDEFRDFEAVSSLLDPASPLHQLAQNWIGFVAEVHARKVEGPVTAESEAKSAASALPAVGEGEASAKPEVYDPAWDEANGFGATEFGDTKASAFRNYIVNAEAYGNPERTRRQISSNTRLGKLAQQVLFIILDLEAFKREEVKDRKTFTERKAALEAAIRNVSHTNAERFLEARLAPMLQTKESVILLAEEKDRADRTQKRELERTAAAEIGKAQTALDGFSILSGTAAALAEQFTAVEAAIQEVERLSGRELTNEKAVAQKIAEIKREGLALAASAREFFGRNHADQHSVTESSADLKLRIGSYKAQEGLPAGYSGDLRKKALGNEAKELSRELEEGVYWHQERLKIASAIRTWEGEAGNESTAVSLRGRVEALKPESEDFFTNEKQRFIQTLSAEVDRIEKRKRALSENLAIETLIQNIEQDVQADKDVSTALATTAERMEAFGRNHSEETKLLDELQRKLGLVRDAHNKKTSERQAIAEIGSEVTRMIQEIEAMSVSETTKPEDVAAKGNEVSQLIQGRSVSETKEGSEWLEAMRRAVAATQARIAEAVSVHERKTNVTLQTTGAAQESADFMGRILALNGLTELAAFEAEVISLQAAVRELHERYSLPETQGIIAAVDSGLTSTISTVRSRLKKAEKAASEQASLKAIRKVIERKILDLGRMKITADTAPAEIDALGEGILELIRVNGVADTAQGVAWISQIPIEVATAKKRIEAAIEKKRNDEKTAEETQTAIAAWEKRIGALGSLDDAVFFEEEVSTLSAEGEAFLVRVDRATKRYIQELQKGLAGSIERNRKRIFNDHQTRLAPKLRGEIQTFGAQSFESLMLLHARAEELRRETEKLSTQMPERSELLTSLEASLNQKRDNILEALVNPVKEEIEAFLRQEFKRVGDAEARAAEIETQKIDTLPDSVLTERDPLRRKLAGYLQAHRNNFEKTAKRERWAAELFQKESEMDGKIRALGNPQNDQGGRRQKIAESMRAILAQANSHIENLPETEQTSWTEKKARAVVRRLERALATYEGRSEMRTGVSIAVRAARIFAAGILAVSTAAELLANPAMFSQLVPVEQRNQERVHALSMLGISAVQLKDAFVLGADLALNRGFLAAIPKIFPGTSFAIIASGEEQKKIEQWVFEHHLGEQVFIVDNLQAARSELRRRGAVRIRGIELAGESTLAGIQEIIRFTSGQLDRFYRFAGILEEVEGLARVSKIFAAAA